jgi:glycosyltransferase involved in cell wall biosynthesis
VTIVDVLFLSWNRLAFTKTAFEALLANTDWSRVRRLRVFDDGSTDGTWEYLIGRCADARRAGILTSAGNMRRGSPVEVMREYLLGKPADLFAKIDNDVVVPPGWLETMLAVMDANPTVELLGMEAGMTEVAGRDGKPWDGVYRVEPATNIGGVGVFRTAAFFDRPELRPDGRFGFTEWQVENDVPRGWITPDLPVPLLDRMPGEPWRSLSEEYVAAGWQREWGVYDPRWMAWAYEWMTDRKETAA